ncbi:hypothetical protein [Pontibacter ramchanderi]|uniref:Uncharacterized protein n=1 Tax=Pontibacter ramchanderi TaxID=1179743 RepID=A0A2N3V0N4_9BACT|nr:hypothetical protein [Pontibacter ramchanderi]PKV75136.1 hypothetical protein BD749_0074 [Pontibacter ramchanderi]
MKTLPFRYGRMRSVTLLLLGIALCTGLGSCDKEPEFNLPPITQEGRNTLGFKANGKVWVNHGDICNFFDCVDNFVDARLHKNPDGTRSLFVRAEYHYSFKDEKKYISQSFSFSAKDVSQPGIYTLTPAHGDMAALEVNMSQNDFYHLVNDAQLTLHVTRLDTVKHIVSGQFEGKLNHYTDGTKTMTISEGRFDTKLTYTW